MPSIVDCFRISTRNTPIVPFNGPSLPPSLALAPSRRGTVSLFLLFILFPLPVFLPLPPPIGQPGGRFLMNFFPLFYFTFTPSSSSLEYPRTCTPFFLFFSLSLSHRERRLNRFALAEASLKWARP